ncbi:MAG: HupE/UreJ family protein [Pseudomonadota bacterium]|nr:HupE/UreJ family protein [Pseudomonadota bacterium]
MRWRGLLSLPSLLLLWTLGNTAIAHETPIALLTLSERQAGLYNVEWTYSSSTNLLPPTAVFPQHCQYDHPRLQCGSDNLHGRLALLQLGERYSAAVVQIERLDKETQTYTLTGANPAIMLTPDGKLPLSQIVASYIPLGFEHIMLGVDHLLFVLGLMWLVSSRWMLFKTITAFTVAHSITLAAVTLGWLGVPEQPVNAAIALSIAIIAVEVLKYQRGEPSWSARMPWAIAFGFGLLHGFGFAGALTGIGLPAENLPAALLFFNVGVELGQISFVVIVLMLLWSHRSLQSHFPRWSETAAIYGIGTLGCFWFLTRLDLILNPV